MNTNPHIDDPRLPARFWSKVVPEPNTGCWLWTATRTAAGYGQIGINYTTHYAHRLTYSTLVAPIPQGLEIDHLCRVRSCCNPAHLEPVTRRENIMRGDGPRIAAKLIELQRDKTRAYWAAVSASITGCPHGHPYDEVNTYVNPRRETRTCRACARIRAARNRAKDRAAMGGVT